MDGYTTTTNIRGSADSIWAVLTDAAGYDRWNPEIARIDGRIALGEKIRPHVLIKPGTIQPVSVRVTTLDAPRLMVWTGGLPLGLFTGRRIFTLESTEPGVTRFTLQLQFRGLLKGPIAGSLGNRQRDIDAFAAGLKEFAERV